MIFKYHMKNKGGVRPGRAIGAVIGGLFLAGFLGLAVGILVKLLWNVTLTPVFDLPAITYWQAVGLFILAKLMFGFGHHNKDHHHDAVMDRKIHHWIGARSEEEVDLPDDMSAFKDYWREEGKAAFEIYMEAKKEDNNND